MPTRPTKISSIPPICGKNPQILILGTMPGEESLKEEKYYCSANNIFWKMIAAIFNDGKDFANYEEKTACLIRNHIALWDVYESCSRSGSSDKNMADTVPNDIAKFLKEHPTIQRIVTNGRKAHSALTKQRICALIAPSTSNANTHQSFEQKVAGWRIVLSEK
ncbi:MAG: DNA-deoxyinosine glycosylase [Bacteroidales bacterium]|nr:DNA-deoxyinosine glycosylase [Bacteroidales bacterium]